MTTEHDRRETSSAEHPSTNGGGPRAHAAPDGVTHDGATHDAGSHETTDRPSDLGFDLPPPAAFSKTRLLAIGVTAIVVLASAFAFGYLPRRHARAELNEGAAVASNKHVRVDVVTPTVVTSDHALVLPASVLPLEETVIYPRANGYVRTWLVDLGDKVTEGQLLAEIDTPEVDQEIDQARAQIAQAQASLVQANASGDLSKTNLDRSQKLVAAGINAQQDLDQRQGQARVDDANVKVAKAAIAAQEANLRRLNDTKSFARLTAPFAGTVTSRTIERGQLVTAGNANPLFKIAAIDPVRVLIGVPQDVAPGVRVDTAAEVTVREYAGQKFSGRVVRTAGALDPATRTMNTEVRVPNPDGKLFAGMFVQVALNLPMSHRVVELPATALYNDAKGLRVAVVGPENTIRLVPVTLERDTGATVQISTGLDGTEHVVKIANASLTDGAVVEIAH